MSNLPERIAGKFVLCIDCFGKLVRCLITCKQRLFVFGPGVVKPGSALALSTVKATGKALQRVSYYKYDFVTASDVAQSCSVIVQSNRPFCVLRVWAQGVD